jgi:hypothetical protein
VSDKVLATKRRIMQIKLQRAFSPEYMVEEECGIYGVPFRVESVVAYVNTGDAGVEVGQACPECVAYLGERNPERFLSISEYHAAVERNPEPVFPPMGDILRVEAEETATMHAVYAASYLT